MLCLCCTREEHLKQNVLIAEDMHPFLFNVGFTPHLSPMAPLFIKLYHFQLELHGCARMIGRWKKIPSPTSVKWNLSNIRFLKNVSNKIQASLATQFRRSWSVLLSCRFSMAKRDFSGALWMLPLHSCKHVHFYGSRQLAQSSILHLYFIKEVIQAKMHLEACSIYSNPPSHRDLN